MFNIEIEVISLFNELNIIIILSIKIIIIIKINKLINNKVIIFIDKVNISFDANDVT